jgi:hypothetical protein
MARKGLVTDAVLRVYVRRLMPFADRLIRFVVGHRMYRATKVRFHVQPLRGCLTLFVLQSYSPGLNHDDTLGKRDKPSGAKPVVPSQTNGVKGLQSMPKNSEIVRAFHYRHSLQAPDN